MIALKVEFLVVGSHALAFHAQPRYTEDIDCWVARSSENAGRIRVALEEFGVGLDESAIQQLTEDKRLLQIGIPPRRVDILTFLNGCECGVALGRAVVGDLSGLKVRVLSLEDYVLTKKASGRAKDLLDLELLRDQVVELPGDCSD
ncbi:MAG: DUF6036 family nucleotidyltransferase [Fimbriimonadaceae bacterium]